MKALLAAVGAGLMLAAPAQAQPPLDEVARDADVTCDILSEAFRVPDLPGDAVAVLGVADSVAGHYGVSHEQAMQIVNWQVFNHCNWHWDTLVMLGDYIRTSDPFA